MPMTIHEKARSRKVEYSVCTMVTQWHLYEEMLSSFYAKGFAEPDCEFIYVDNRGGTSHDGHQSVNAFLSEASGHYIILCHQDIALIDDRSKLDRAISSMNSTDNSWGLLGNAGGYQFGRLAVRISDPRGADRTRGALPCKVRSLDENFLIVNRRQNLGVPSAITGFHFYGTSLCLQARNLGRTCYVIDFHVRHASRGKIDSSFRRARKELIEHHRKAKRGEWVQTTCTGLYVSRSRLINGIMNCWPVVRLSRELCRRGRAR